MTHIKISDEQPPYGVMQKCAEKFDLSQSCPIFTFNDTIYNPHDGEIDEYLISHERVHMAQQQRDPHGWWDNYLAIPQFRFDQELQAYRVQFRVMKTTIKDRNALARALFDMSKDLSSPMYGSMCTQSEASKAIKKGI